MLWPPIQVLIKDPGCLGMPEILREARKSELFQGLRVLARRSPDDALPAILEVGPVSRRDLEPRPGEPTQTNRDELPGPIWAVRGPIRDCWGPIGPYWGARAPFGRPI